MSTSTRTSCFARAAGTNRTRPRPLPLQEPEFDLDRPPSTILDLFFFIWKACGMESCDQEKLRCDGGNTSTVLLDPNRRVASVGPMDEGGDVRNPWRRFGACKDVCELVFVKQSMSVPFESNRTRCENRSARGAPSLPSAVESFFYYEVAWTLAEETPLDSVLPPRTPREGDASFQSSQRSMSCCLLSNLKVKRRGNTRTPWGLVENEV